MAIEKYLWLVSHSLSLFLEKKEFLEPPLIMIDINKHKFLLVQILKEIYTDIELANCLGFKGGTALMLYKDFPILVSSHVYKVGFRTPVINKN